MKINNFVTLILLLTYSSITISAESNTFTKKGNGSTYLSDKAGCSEARDRAISNAKNACYTNGFTECDLVSTKLISQKNALVEGSFNHLGTCLFEATVSGSSLDSTKASDEEERRN